MKKLIHTIVLLVSMLSVKAEYENWMLKFIVEQTDGKKITGYACDPGFNKDSINNTRYLIKVLGDGSTIRFSKNRIRYDYDLHDGNGQTYEYKLINEVTIKTNNIRKITVQEVINWAFVYEIRNDLTLQDTAWMKTKVVKTEAMEGGTYDIELYLHEYNSELEKLVKELKVQAKKAKASDDNTIMEAVLKKIMRYKVIVIANWMC